MLLINATNKLGHVESCDEHRSREKEFKVPICMQVVSHNYETENIFFFGNTTGSLGVREKL